ncbi:hypothetical protein LY90DRAFT_234118 [Neocallimastix californiae]|uniref:Uncharacterized protein n=1 Tax=Neocallimastix californiae TaxID=1754190 RepID=A0A1Y2DVV8_9FUNG|nr:hypothetical protein LY90DRAFT_234118 [Neocallimastix californiae]|eukprot:ORY62775.1 hypothetical protein LY90DRAFT_234118 [Neocallimastix californiae]
MRILEFLFLIIIGIYINSSIVSALPFDLNEFFSNPNNKSPEELLKMIENYQYEFPNYDWEVDTGKSLMFDIPNDQMMIKSIDAGLFYKDIKEETYCNYSYSSSYKKHYMLCHAVIKNYSKEILPKLTTFILILVLIKNQYVVLAMKLLLIPFLKLDYTMIMAKKLNFLVN